MPSIGSASSKQLAAPQVDIYTLATPVIWLLLISRFTMRGGGLAMPLHPSHPSLGIPSVDTQTIHLRYKGCGR